MRNSKTKGFTLIELIVVMAIIGVLAAILVPSMIGYLTDSKFSKANANAKQVYQSAANWCTKCEVNSTPIASLKFSNVDLTDDTKTNADIKYTGSSDADLKTDLTTALCVYMGGNTNSGIAAGEIETSAPKWAQWAGSSADVNGTKKIFGQYPKELNANNVSSATFGGEVTT